MDIFEIQKRASNSLAGVAGGMCVSYLVRDNSDSLQNQQRILTV